MHGIMAEVDRWALRGVGNLTLSPSRLAPHNFIGTLIIRGSFWCAVTGSPGVEHEVVLFWCCHPEACMGLEKGHTHTPKD